MITDGALAETGGAETDEPTRLGLGIRDVEVEVHPVLRGARFGHALDEQGTAGAAVEGDEHGVLLDLVRSPVAQGLRPELGDAVHVDRIEHFPEDRWADAVARFDEWSTATD